MMLPEASLALQASRQTFGLQPVKIEDRWAEESILSLSAAAPHFHPLCSPSHTVRFTKYNPQNRSLFKEEGRCETSETCGDSQKV